MRLKRSNFASAHGMYVEENVSTAADVARLCYFTMKNSKFREVVWKALKVVLGRGRNVCRTAYICYS